MLVSFHCKNASFTSISALKYRHIISPLPAKNFLEIARSRHTIELYIEFNGSG